MNKYKQVEELLKNYTMMKASIENMEDEIEYLKREDGMTGIAYDGVSTSPTYSFSSITEDTAISNSEKIHYFEQQIECTERQLEKIDKALEGLNETEQRIIKLKYIEGLQWWQVAYQVRYSERWCKHLRNQAIKKMIIGIYGR